MKPNIEGFPTNGVNRKTAGKRDLYVGLVERFGREATIENVSLCLATKAEQLPGLRDCVALQVAVLVPAAPDNARQQPEN